jgi:hypothetical protein
LSQISLSGEIASWENDPSTTRPAKAWRVFHDRVQSLALKEAGHHEQRA